MNTIMDDEDDISLFHWIQWKLLTFDKYLSAFTENVSVTAIGLISASLVTAILTWVLTKDNNSFQDNLEVEDKTKFVKKPMKGNIDSKSIDTTSNDLRKRKGNKKLSHSIIIFTIIWYKKVYLVLHFRS